MSVIIPPLSTKHVAPCDRETHLISTVEEEEEEEDVNVVDEEEEGVQRVVKEKSVSPKLKGKSNDLDDLTDFSDVIQFLESPEFTSLQNSHLKHFKRWVGGSNSSSTAVNGNEYSQTCTTTLEATSTKAVLHHHHHDTEDQEFGHPLLGEPNVEETVNSSLFGHIPIAPSPVNSSPSIGHIRRHNFTIVPMKAKRGKDKIDPKLSKRHGNEALGLVLSALYGKLLVVMGIAFPMSEVISTYIPPSFYDGFYLYLYFGSIMFMISVYGNILRHKATRSVRSTIRRINSLRLRQVAENINGGGCVQAVAIVPPSTDDPGCSDQGSCGSESPTPPPMQPPIHPNIHFEATEGCHQHHHHVHRHRDELTNSDSSSLAHQRIHFGSFYLRMGAVAFGVGSMIYSGLEFGQYFELEPDTKCHNFMIALTPAVRMIFTFMQMYFIFLNSKMAVSKVRLGAQFGLMHLIGTNLCVWLSVLVQETRHEILHFYNPDNHTITLPKFGWNSISLPGASIENGTESAVLNITSNDEIFATVATAILSHDVEGAHLRVRRGLKGPHSIYECRRTDIMGSLVQNASPFLFPCTIEYSLICAAILYVMWKSMAKRAGASHFSRTHTHNGDSHMGTKRSPHYYSVDCARANKGLFLGIFVLVMTIISLILFFVLITRPGYQNLATLEVNITELALYTISTIAVLIGMCQVRELKYSQGRNLELDNILLIVAQTGSFIYNVFTIIGGHFTMKKNTVLVLLTALASLIQLLFQTIFILDASNRCASNAEQARRKPGREIVTFLLVTNLAMWAINTLEKSRADSHPVQLNFYGVWAWTIITHISMPLAIFYRFHSTVCLCEIWKKAYKVKSSSSNYY